MDGFLNFHKPHGWTSHDCVGFVRRQAGLKKVGHAGTLDPAATGVLPMALGRATRLLPYLPSDKTYRATVRFGIRTTTDDLEGDIIHRETALHLNLDQVRPWLDEFRGVIRQVPPRYSAIQVEGRRLYNLARSGVDVDVPMRTVEVYQLQVLQWRPSAETPATATPDDSGPELDLTIACSSGTYIRSIARDLGDRVGTGATLAGLCRTYSSGFDLHNSLTPAELEQAIQTQSLALIHPATALQHLPALHLDADTARRWRMGQRIVLPSTPPGSAPPDSTSPVPPLNADPIPVQIVRVMEPGDRFLGIGQAEALAAPPAELQASEAIEHQSAENTAFDANHYLLRPKMVFCPIS